MPPCAHGIVPIEDPLALEDGPMGLAEGLLGVVGKVVRVLGPSVSVGADHKSRRLEAIMISPRRKDVNEVDDRTLCSN